jgi:hypothetical protein
MALLTAGDVKLIGPLKESLRGYSTAGKGSLADALGRISTQNNTSAIASGRPQGQYIGQSLNQANVLAGRGIDDSLANSLGAASLSEKKAQNEHADNLALARMIGEQNSPNDLMEALGALGNAAESGAQLYGAYKGMPKSQPSGSRNPLFGLSSPDNYGFSPRRQPYGF